MTHYNCGRPHSTLGPGVPDPPEKHEGAPKLEHRHGLAANAIVLVKSILGGLHHEYSHVAMPTSP
jgi:putative transposase